MSGEIKRVLRSDMALASLDHHLIKQARVPYRYVELTLLTDASADNLINSGNVFFEEFSVYEF